MLRDSILENTSHEDLDAALRPKVQASWKFRTQLSTDISFFILLLSLEDVIGNSGLSNDAAGNTCQHALAAAGTPRHDATGGLCR
jgi:hypothetical protein